MRPSLTSRPLAVRRFTMIEVLVVVGLMVMIMMMTGPAFEKMAVGSGVDGAARMVTGELRLARQYAISKRKFVAIVMPNDENFSVDSCYTGLRACEADSLAGPYTWVSNSNWEFVPAGAIIAEADDDVGTTNPPTPATESNPTLINVDTDGNGTADVAGARAIVFRPGGTANSSGTTYVTVAEGFYTNSTVTVRQENDTIDIELNPFTGRARTR